MNEDIKDFIKQKVLHEYGKKWSYGRPHGPDVYVEDVIKLFEETEQYKKECLFD